MTLATVQVRIQCRTPQGQAVPGARVRCKLTHAEVDEALVVPLLVEGIADSAGDCVLSLWPNERSTQGSQYQVSIATASEAGGNLLFVGHISVPAALLLHQPVPFELLVGRTPYPRVPANEIALARLQAAEVSIAGSVGQALASQTASAASLSAASAAQAVSEAARDIATTKASEAAGSANTAGQQAGIASTKAWEAATSAIAASQQAGIASTKAGEAAASATTAGQQAGIASTKAGEAAGSAGSAAASQTASSLSETNAAQSRTAAESAALIATAQAALALTRQAASESAASQAAASAASAASVAQQDLSAVASQLHHGNSVALFIYDTSRDSDGGAWTQRSSHCSWAREALAGNWLGRAANEAAARALPNAATASYYQNTTDGKFYMLSAGSGQTETRRGQSSTYPRLAAIVAESTAGAARIITYDLTAPGRPMWDVFEGVNNGIVNIGASALIRGLFALNGRVFNSRSVNGMSWVCYPSDSFALGLGAGTCLGRGSLASARNSAPAYDPAVAYYLYNAACWDVAAAVLPGTPVNVASGLPAPTVVVGTNGRVTVLRPNTSASYSAIHSAGPDAEWRGVSIGPAPAFAVRALRGGAAIGQHQGPSLVGIASAFVMTQYAGGSRPDARGVGTAVLPSQRHRSEEFGMAWDEGAGAASVQLLRGSPQLSGGGVLARISADSNSGYMFGQNLRTWAAAFVLANMGVDVSPRRQNITVNGAPTASPVAPGAQLSALGGFSAAHYLQEAYHADWDLGTAPWTVSAWVRLGSASSGVLLHRAAASGASISIEVNASRQFVATVSDGSATRTATTGAQHALNAWHKLRVNYNAGTLTIFVNGVQAASATGAALLTLNNPVATVTVGNNRTLTSPWPGDLCLLKLSAGAVPTAEQALWMWAEEAQMFAANAQVGLAQSSAPLDLVHCVERDQWLVVQSAAASRFAGLVRVGVHTPSSGSYSQATSAGAADLLARGAAGVDVLLPAQALRSDLVRLRSAPTAQTQVEEVFDFTATTGQTAFVLPIGYTATRITSAGTQQREGTTAAFTRAWDGWTETINFAVAPGNGTWVQISARRFA